MSWGYTLHRGGICALTANTKAQNFVGLQGNVLAPPKNLIQDEDPECYEETFLE
jgi:hypothetical protein